MKASSRSNLDKAKEPRKVTPLSLTKIKDGKTQEQTISDNANYYLRTRFSLDEPTTDPNTRIHYYDTTMMEGFTVYIIMCNDLIRDTIENLQARNYYLKEELKVMNEQLTSTLNKQKIYRTEPVYKTMRSASENPNTEARLQLEMDTARKQLEGYQKEYKSLKTKYEHAVSLSKTNRTRIDEMYEKTFELDQQIQMETEANKSLEKMIREKDREIDRLQNNSVSSQKEAVTADALIAMSSKYRQVSENEMRLQNQAQSKEQYMRGLEKELRKLREDYQQISERTSYTNNRSGYMSDRTKKSERTNTKSLSRSRRHHIENEFLRKSSVGVLRTKADEVLTLPVIFRYSEENFYKLQLNLSVHDKAFQGKAKQRQREVQNWKTRILTTEEEKEKAKEILDEKEKEIEVLRNAFKTLNTIALRYNIQVPSQECKSPRKFKIFIEKSVSPKTQDKVQLPQISERTYKSEKPEKKEVIEKPFKTQREDNGEFDDTSVVGNKIVKICGIRVWYDGERLNGIQAIYKTPNGERIEGKKHGKKHYKYRVAKFEMEGEDYMKDLRGFLNPEGTAVECLIFRSYFGENRRVGKFSENSRAFKYDVNAYEFPAIIYGTITEEDGESILARLGVLIGSDKIRENPKTDRSKNLNGGIMGPVRAVNPQKGT